jgi:hypothetical protein
VLSFLNNEPSFVWYASNVACTHASRGVKAQRLIIGSMHHHRDHPASSAQETNNVTMQVGFVSLTEIDESGAVIHSEVRGRL